MKKTTIITIVLIVIMVALLAFYRLTYVKPAPINQEATSTPIVLGDIHNATYTINEEQINLQNGKVETAIPDSSATTTTTYFGNDAQGDFDGNGVLDTAFIVTQTGEGSGTFYYLVAVLNQTDGTRIGTYGYLLGDRVAPQAITVENQNIITVSYADRKDTDPFTTAPSVMKSVSLKYNAATNHFDKVISSVTTSTTTVTTTKPVTTAKLTDKTWGWTKTTYSNGQVVAPIRTDKFKLTFTDKGGFSISTDCNGVGGEYVVSGNKITFDKMISTMMYCEGSQEGDFTKMIAAVQTFTLSPTALVFKLSDGGVMTFN